MCTIHTGNQIKKKTDVQNLVTAYILRSHQPYCIPSLCDEVRKSCQGSAIPISDSFISDLVKETTIALLRSNYIIPSKNAGTYFPLPISVEC